MQARTMWARREGLMIESDLYASIPRLAIELGKDGLDRRLDSI
jgi:hypothetical protein